MLKKPLFFLLCVSFASVVYAQVAGLGLYHGRKLPMPKDPDTCGAMTFSQADMERKDKAQAMIDEGKSALALEELKKISNEWASHWFISYLYEMDNDLQNALYEIGHLRGSHMCHEISMLLEHREDSIRKTIQGMEDWQKHLDDTRPSLPKEKQVVE